MQKRLFIAISLPDEIKEKLVSVQRKFRKLNIRWIKPENLHFTLLFIGWVEEDKIETIKEIIRKAVYGLSPFILKLEKVVLGPDGKRPRMVWAVGPCVSELNKLRERIASKFKKHNIKFEDRHSLKLHITLARARGKELFGRKIEESLDLIFPVEEVFLMGSELKKEGAEYKKLLVANFHKYDHKSHE
jgi:2'-5' RNA ligase